MRAADLHKERFGRLTVYHKLSFRNKYGRLLWLCVCDCGGQKIAQSSDLSGGRVKSCGCARNPSGRSNPMWKPKVTVRCAYCGKEKEMHQSRAKAYKKKFCDDVCRGKWMSENSSGENNHRWTGKVKVKCEWCGKEKEVFPSQQKAYTNHFCDGACYGSWRGKNVVGENNPNWKDGVSLDPYCPIWNYKSFRKDLFARDNHRCQNPHCFGDNENLSLHHIDYDKKNCHPDNLITLCVSCNSRANANRDWHTSFYQALMQRSGKTISKYNHQHEVRP